MCLEEHPVARAVILLGLEVDMNTYKLFKKLNIREILDYELPVTTRCNLNENNLRDMEEWFQIANTEWWVYQFTSGEKDHIEDYAKQYLAMMLDALRILFNEDTTEIKKYFNCEMMDKYGDMFIEYAKFTFMNNHASIYGRFDMRVVDGIPRGMYEYNGDTPVMLFESLALNHHLVGDIKNTTELNEWFSSAVNHRGHYGIGPNGVTICDTNTWDDSSTAEMISQAMDWPLVDFRALDYDHANLFNPWVLCDQTEPLTDIFALLPWEEMVVNFPEAFRNWRYWANTTRFYEPAWKWFISNKGMMAYITNLIETNQQFKHNYGIVKHLETRMTDEKFRDRQIAYVEKPSTGRLSMNVSFYDKNGNLIRKSAGGYSETQKVYQEYAKPGHTENGNFIVGYWTPPFFPCSISSDSGTMCIREFDGMETDLANERFRPHVVSV